MRQLKFKITLLAGSLILSAAIFVTAQDDINQDDPFDKLTYPIAELGNCADKETCGVYCDKPANMERCLNFAQANNLMPEEDIEMGKRMLALGKTEGPGGCVGRRACEAYCDEIANIKECIAFAQENNLIPPDELEEAKKVIQAIDKGLTPPKCKGKKECDVYCSRPENMEECITFASAAGLMPPEERQDAEKMLAALRAGLKPPNCAGKEACDLYCSQPANMGECMEFALAAGFMPSEEAENARKALNAIKQGVRPPNCRGEEECNTYCSQPEHMGECMEFAIAAGFMPPDEIENAKKTLEAIKKGVMPPNCRGEEECDVYCSQPEHSEECLNFAEAAGFISPEDAQRAREGGGAGPGGCQSKEECEAFCSQPENMEICIDFSVQRGDISPEEAERMRQGPQGQMPAGPGGCKTEAECQNYCQDPAHLEECRQFAPGGEQGVPQMPQMPQEGTNGLPQGFEGKCNSPDSCFQYCAQNFQDPACQSAVGNPGENLTPPPEGIAPPPETTSPPPTEPEHQTFLNWTKKMLANILSAILGF